jgi:hypothetical protein
MSYHTMQGSSNSLGGWNPFKKKGGGSKHSQAPMPQAPDAKARGWDKEMTEMRHKHEMEMMKLRMEMMQMMRQGKDVPASVKEKVAKATSAPPGSAEAAAAVKRLAEELEALKRSQKMAKQGGTTTGTTKTKKELLAPGAKQEAWMRSTKKKGANKHWKSWERLKKLIPANFNEAKYLANNPDVANAVSSGAMPSGAWHYAMYGMGAGCQASQDPSGRGKCDKATRTFSGYRRPGYLSGIFSNWNQADW